MDSQHRTQQFKDQFLSHTQAVKDNHQMATQQRKLHNRRKYNFAFALIVSLLMLAGVSSGKFYSINCTLADAMYQSTDHFTDEILVIGIDSYALQELGDWPWERDLMADVLLALNADPDNQPAAIGVDVLYVMENDPEVDQYLIDTLSTMDNVVLASAVEFTRGMVVDEMNSGYMTDYAVSAYETPFDALAAVVPYGHVNSMFDTDGVLRHHLWSVPSEDSKDEEILSMPYLLYQMYCENKGIEADFSPSLSSAGFWWVDYSATPKSFYAYSVADILYGEFDPAVIKDAVILIGPYNAGMSDDYITAADHAQTMYGVEYISNVTNAMIRSADKHEVSQGIQRTMLFVFTFMVVLLFISSSVRWSWLMGLLLIAFSVCTDILAYEYLDIVILPLWPLVAVVFAWVVSLAEHYTIAQLEQRRISRTFQHYVDPEVMKELLKGDEASLDLGGRTVDIAVLFVDIRNFTTLSEQLSPESVVDVLNSYLSLTSKSIKKTYGTLDKFVGDCAMAFWGAPLACQDPIYDACVSAMSMLEGGKALETAIFEKYGLHIAFGVGIHYGSAVVGNIGAEDRMDYTAIGDTVNTASRLESNAPAGKIYISRVIADALGERAKTTSLGDSVSLKGKDTGFEVLSLDWLEMPSEL